MKKLSTIFSMVVLCLLLTKKSNAKTVDEYSFVEPIPNITIRFSNPQFECQNGEYCLDVEFKSDIINQEIFGMNVRFFYDDSVLELIDFRNFRDGYGLVPPTPPLVFTGNSSSGPTLFNFSGPAEYVNGAIQLINNQADPVYISTTGWTMLYQVCFKVDDPSPDVYSFAPSVVWDKEKNIDNGGFFGGSDGVVITVVNPDPNMDSAPSIEKVKQFNWQYTGNGSMPFGKPKKNYKINIDCKDLMAVPISGEISEGNQILENSTEKRNSFTLAPNPTSGWMKLTFLSDQPNVYNIQIVDLSGVVQYVDSKYYSKGSVFYTLDVNRLPQGMYQIVIDNAEEVVWTSKFVKI